MKKIIIIGLLIIAAAYLSHQLRTAGKPEAWNVSGPPQTELKILKRAFYYIKNNYIEPDRLEPLAVLKSGLTALQKGLAPLMVQWLPEEFIIEVAGERRRFDIPENLNQFPDLLGHVADFIKAEIPETLEENKEEKNLEYLLLSGVLSALDPHSTFLSPKVYAEFKIGTKGNFGGIGIAIGIREGHLTVIAPLEGTPAYRAGLKSKDRIVQIGDERTINMQLTEAVERLRGEIGTKVTILVEREGRTEPLSFTLRRALIKIDSVKAELLGKKILLVKIKNFQEDTTQEVSRQLRQLARKADELKGIILDLRNNPGGLLNQAVAVADLFLTKGIIVSTVGFNDHLNERDVARRNDPYEDIPLLVLVNEGSASASEIIAGALQAHNRALIIGNQTFGKGTVQTIYDLKDGSAIKLTIAKYLAAGTEDVQSFGIIPDLELIPVQITEKRTDLVENTTRREKDLEKRLKKTTESRVPREPLFKVRYLEKPETEENITGTVSLAHDYPVQLAQQFLLEKSAFSREALLQEIVPLIREAEETQNQQISKQFSSLGIDWTQGDKQGTPEAKTRFWITKQGEEVDHIAGGEEIELHVEVKNTGSGPHYQLIGITQSSNPFLNDLEFPLGKIEAGKSQKYSLPMTVPAAIVSRREPITLRFEEAYGRIPEETDYPIRAEAPQAPRFAYQWHFNESFAKLPVGRDLDLTIEVENIGLGTSEKPVINLTNLEGEQVFLTRGRATLEPIKPGTRQEAVLTIRLRKGYDKKTARFQLSIEDHRTADFLRDKIVLSLGDEPHDPPNTTRQIPPELELELPDTPYWSQKDQYTFSGIVHDDEAIKQIYVFVGTDKVFYQAASSKNLTSGRGPAPETPTADLPITVSIPLKKGENRVTVIAEDNANLISRYDWIVWRPEKK